jgi:low temperature requirement protein LtrA
VSADHAASSSGAGPASQVTNLELFFDLVFVFTVTQLTTVVEHDPHPAGILRGGLELGVVWWMYGGYAWLTNAVPPRSVSVRLLVLLGMAAFLGVALAIPSAFDAGGLVFGLSYLLVNVVHLGLFTRAGGPTTPMAVARLAPFNLVSAGLLLGAAFVTGWADWAAWSIAVGLQWVTPYLSSIGGFRISAAHFAERHGLIVLIALGESLLAVAIGTSTRPLTAARLLAAGLGLALAAVMWWLYFDGDDEAAADALARTPEQERPWAALRVYGYAFLPLLGGVVLVAAALKAAFVSPGRAVPLPDAVLLAGGAALYLVALSRVRVVLGLPRPWPRALTAVVALVTVPAGVLASAEVQLLALVGLLVVLVIVERRLPAVDGDRRRAGA